MKFKFLGTSHGVPSSTRYCQSILIEVGEYAYLIDAGAPVMDLLIREHYDLNKIKGVFITHLHGDHMDGLSKLIELSTWFYKDMKFDVYLPEQRGIDALTAYCNMTLYGQISQNINYKMISEGDFYSDENIQITAVPNQHMYASSGISYGFMVSGEDKRVYITGDMHYSLDDFPEKLLSSKTDAIICECAHFSVEGLFNKLKDTNTDNVFVIHVYPEDKYDLLRDIASSVEYKLYLPDDGDEFSI